MRATRLGKFQWLAVLPPVVVFFLGLVLCFSDFQNTAITWFAISLPLVWSTVASVVLLTLGPGRRYLIRNTRQPFFFMLFWLASAVWSSLILPDFPGLVSSTGVPSRAMVIAINMLNILVIIVVGLVFFWQRKCDVSKKRI